MQQHQALYLQFLLVVAVLVETAKAEVALVEFGLVIAILLLLAL
jgi:hypothetical protein